MIKHKLWLIIIVYLVVFIFFGLEYGTTATPPITELTVIGVSRIGFDQDIIYQNAIYDGFLKAYEQVRPKSNLSINQKKIESKNDLILAQQELGITEYNVLRYWREQDNFYVELKVIFGTPKIDQPRSHRLPKMDWVYQTNDRITLISPGSSFLAVLTPQTIEVLDPDSGKRKQWIKMGLVPHSIQGDRYLIQDNDDLKLCDYKKFNVYNLLNYNLIYKWRIKAPNLYRFYLSDQAVYAIQRSGLVNAYNLENGKEKWKLQANSQIELNQTSPKHLLIFLPNNEFWMINENGEKLWIKKFEKELAGKPVMTGNELFMLFKDGQLLIINPDTGQDMSTFTVKFKGTPQRTNLVLDNQKVMIFYNDSSSKPKGNFHVYQKYTGTLVWETAWQEAIADSIIVLPDLIMFGIHNTLEARDPALGLKLWEEKISGIVKQLEWTNNRLYIVIGEKIFGYHLQ